MPMVSFLWRCNGLFFVPLGDQRCFGTMSQQVLEDYYKALEVDDDATEENIILNYLHCELAGMHIYARASAKGKRVQSNMGAKNHAIVMPDANVDATLNAIVAAGQRCMALSTVVFVGGLKSCQVKCKSLMVVGTLRGFDQYMNLVIDNTVEVNGKDKNDIGMVVIRGIRVVTVEALEPVNRN